MKIYFHNFPNFNIVSGVKMAVEKEVKANEMLKAEKIFKDEAGE